MLGTIKLGYFTAAGGDTAGPDWVSPAAGSLGVYTTRVAIADITLTASDPESNGENFAVSAGSLPSGLSLTDNGNGTATISGTPDYVSSETISSFTVEATDNSGNATGRNFSITVRPNYWGDSSDGAYSDGND